MRQIEEALVVGVRVNRCHPTPPEAKRVVQHLGHRGQAIRRARRVGNDVVTRRVVLVVVDTKNDHEIRPLGRGGDDDLPCAGRNVLGSVVPFCEEPGRLEDDIDAKVPPREGAWVAFRQHLERPVTDANTLAIHRNRFRQIAQNRVIFQEVSQCVHAGDVIDRYELQLLLVECRSENIASDPPKSVNSDLDGHALRLQNACRRLVGAPCPSRTGHSSERPCGRSNTRLILPAQQPVHLLYSVALLFYFFLALLPVVAYKRLRHGKAVGRVADRLGRVPDAINPSHARSIWIHAVSVGEVLAARSLLSALRRAYPAHRLLLSTTTANRSRGR